MAEYLVIRMGDSPSALASWIVVDDNGNRRSPPVTGALPEASKDVRERPVIVLVPAALALTATVDLPAKGARLLAALPFALEDQLADDVENLHFAPGKRLDDGKLPVAVATHASMQEWLDALEDAGIRPWKLVPENHGLAHVPNTLSLLVSNGQVYFNNGHDIDIALADMGPSDVLAVAGVLDDDSADDDEERAARHLLVYCEPADNQAFEHDFNALRNELDSVDVNLLPDGVLPRLAVTVASGAGINLLQGQYGERTEVAALLKPWRYAAMLLLGLGLAGFITKGVDFYRLTQEEAALQQQFAVEYQQLTGDTRVPEDPIAAVTSLERRVGSGGTSSANPVFLPSLQELAGALQQNSDAQIEAITYRAGVINVRMNAPDVATLDSIQKRISESARFDASIQSTDAVGERINSRIEIRADGV